jgi:hypothetical protein
LTQQERTELGNFFRVNYGSVSQISAEISDLIGIEMGFFDKKKNLARIMGARSLDWLCNELSGPKDQK